MLGGELVEYVSGVAESVRDVSVAVQAGSAVQLNLGT